MTNRRELNAILIDIYNEMCDEIDVFYNKCALRPGRVLGVLNFSLFESYFDLVEYLSDEYEDNYSYDSAEGCHIFAYELDEPAEVEAFSKIKEFVEQYNDIYGKDYEIKLYE